MQIEKLILIGKNGDRLPEEMSLAQRREKFPPAGIVKVVAIEWVYKDVIYHLDLLSNNCKINWEKLPDRSGFLLVSNTGQTSLAYVLNADNTVRYRLENPLLQSDFYEKGDECGFLYPAYEGDKLGCHAYIWSPPKDQKGGINSDFFLSLDLDQGKLFESHRVK